MTTKIESAILSCVKKLDNLGSYGFETNIVKTRPLVRGKFYGWNEDKTQKVGTIYVKADETELAPLNQKLSNGEKLIFNDQAESGFNNFSPNFIEYYIILKKQYIPQELIDEYTNRLDIVFTKNDKTKKLTIIDVTGFKIFDFKSKTELISRESKNEQDEFILDPNYKGAPKADKEGQSGTTTQTTDKGGSWKDGIERLGKTFNMDPENVKGITKWFEEHAVLGPIVAGMGGYALFTALSPLLAGGAASGLLSTLATPLQYGLIALALNAFAPELIKQLKETGAEIGTALFPQGFSGATQGKGLSGLLASTFGADLDDYIVFDKGAKTDEPTAMLQRCLIRIAGGNLEAERRNYQQPIYTPIIGEKPGTKRNYADDGRYGSWTVDAVANNMTAINTANKDAIKADPKIEIKKAFEVNMKVLSSPACSGKTNKRPTPEEVQAANKLKPQQKESKVYKEYSFLSEKNNRLNSVLMEKLIKDIKRA